MRKADRISGIITVLVGMGVVYIASDMRIQRGGVPGPGLLPLICGALLILFGVILIARPSEPGISINWPPREDGMRVMGTLAAMAMYTALVPYLGFTLATFLLLSALSRWWGDYSVLKAGVIGAAISVSMMIVFQVLLGAPLPTGFWG